MKSAIEIAKAKLAQKRLISDDLKPFVDYFNWLRFCIYELKESNLVDEYGDFMCYMLGELSMIGIKVEDIKQDISKQNYIQKYFKLDEILDWDNLKNIDPDHNYKIKRRGRYGKVLVSE